MMEYIGLTFIAVWTVVFIYAMFAGWGDYRPPEKRRSPAGKL
jgi:hypothetical protein